MKDNRIITASSVMPVNPISIGDDGVEREFNADTGEFEHGKDKSSK